MRAKRKRFIGLRLTEQEYVELMERMKNVNCKSISKYMRHQVLSGRKYVSHANNEEVASVLSAFTFEIKKIGVNYNQVVKNYNAQRQSMSSFQTERLMKQLEKLTKQLLSNAIEIKNKIEEKL